MKRMCYIVEMNSALEGLFELLDDYGFDKNAKVNAGFLAITSRIGLKYQYTLNNLKLGAHIEGDFCGTATYIDIFRLRHAYASIAYKNHTLLVGQTWHPYYDGIFPNVLTLPPAWTATSPPSSGCS